MRIEDRAQALRRKLKLDSHHGIERFGVTFTIFVVLGAGFIVASGVSSYYRAHELLGSKVLYTPKFTTSKTQMSGTVDGVYVNHAHDEALVMMHFGSDEQISHDPGTYRAFLLGSDSSLSDQPLETPGVTGSFHVFGSTGYIGVLLKSDHRFRPQVLNLTMRANAQLTYNSTGTTTTDPTNAAEGDASFKKYDQWRVYFNLGANGAHEISALNRASFDPAQAYYEIVTKHQEQSARGALDRQLLQMRADLARITSDNLDMATTKVDGLFLKPPSVPSIVSGDQVTGKSASESGNGTSSLTLRTKTVVPGGFNLNWRPGNVYQGYLDQVVPPGQNYGTYLTAKQQQSAGSSAETQLTDMTWMLSNGTDLSNDYTSSDSSAMRPLTTIMNNLSQAYQTYYTDKAEYQGPLTLNLLQLDVDLRDVAANNKVNDSPAFLATYY